MADFINTVDVIGDETLTNSIIDRSITEIYDNYATSIGYAAFESCPSLTIAVFSSARSIGYFAFENCSSLTTVDFPMVTNVEGFEGCTSLITTNFPAATNIEVNAFKKCSALTEANFPAVTLIGRSAFYNCSSLAIADFPTVISIYSSAFSSCSKLISLILRSQTMATLDDTDAFTNTPIASGTGYIYVPSSLIDSYKTASNWSTYAAQFRALEDYTVDGTITGALDESKI